MDYPLPSHHYPADILTTKSRLLITSAAYAIFKYTPELFYHSLRQTVCILIRLLLGSSLIWVHMPPKCIRTTIVIFSEKRANHYSKLLCRIDTTLKIITSIADGLTLRVHFKFTQKFVVFLFCLFSSFVIFM